MFKIGKFEGLSFLFDGDEEADPDALDLESALSRASPTKQRETERKEENLVFGIKASLMGKDKAEKERLERERINRLRLSQDSDDTTTDEDAKPSPRNELG